MCELPGFTGTFGRGIGTAVPTLGKLSRDQIQGVVFDLDGTLYDKRPLERALALSMPWWIGRLLRYTRVRKSFAGEDYGTDEALWEASLARLSRHPKGQERWRRWVRETYDPGLLRCFARVVKPYPGVATLLEDLRAAGLRLGLVSDYRGIDKRIACLGLRMDAFDYCMVTETHGAMKPAVRMAEATLRGMGLAGSSMVMVGDRAFADEQFASVAGMAFEGVTAPGENPVGANWHLWSGVRARLSELCR